MTFQFNFDNLERQYKSVIDLGYQFLTCQDYQLSKPLLPPLTVVNRVDIDISVRKAERLLDIFDRLELKQHFSYVYMRMNIILLVWYRILRGFGIVAMRLIPYEVIDQSIIWNESALECHDVM